MALSTVFHSINSLDDSPFSYSVLPDLLLPYLVHSTIYLFMKVSFSPDINRSGLAGLKVPTNNSFLPPWLVVFKALMSANVSLGNCGGGFFRDCEDLGRMFDHSFPACTFCFFEAEISSRTLIPLFMPGSIHSGSAS